MRRTDRASGLDYLSFTQVKNAARKPVEVAIPILPQLQQILDASDFGDEVYAIGGKGQACTAKGIGGKFKRWTRAAGLPEECALHGLRKASCGRMAELGLTAHEIMAITGRTTMKEVQRYTAAYARKRAAFAGAAKLALAA